MIGSALGSLIQKGPKIMQEGPRLSDLRVSNSAYGVAIPYAWGMQRIAGNVIDASTIRETRYESTTREDGKGGGGAAVTNVTYTYAVDLDVYVCRGEIHGLRRIWADGKIIWDATVTDANVVGESGTVSVSSQRFVNDNIDFTLYYGSETQLADPTFEALHGVGNVPAYRGVAHVVFTSLQLGQFGNRVPNLTFETVKAGTQDVTGLAGITLTDGARAPWADAEGNYAYFAGTSQNKVFVTNAAGTLLATFQDANVYNAVLLASDTAGNVYSAGGTSNKIGKLQGAVEVAQITLPAGTYGLIMTSAPQGGFMKGVFRDDNVHSNASFFAAFDGASLAWNLTFDFNGDYPLTMAISTTGNLVATTELAPDHRFWLWPHGGNPARYASAASPLPAYKGCQWSSDGFIYLVDTASFRIDVYNASGVFQNTINLPNVGANPIMLAQNRSGTVYAWGGQYVHRIYQGAIAATYGPFNYSAPANFNFHGSESGVFYVGGHSAVPEHAYRLTLSSVRTNGTTSLGEIVTEICTEVGLEAADINVESLDDITVLGYVIGAVTPARACLEQLQKAFYFDIVESAGILKFVMRGGAAVRSIDKASLAAHRDGETVTGPFQIARLDEIELPRVVNLSFPDADRDYEPGAQSASRQTVSTVNITAEELPIVMDNEKAREVCEVLLYSAWQERNRFQLKCSIANFDLEPADVIRISNDVATYTVRLTKQLIDRNLISFEAVLDDANVYSATPLSAAPLGEQNVIAVLEDGVLVLMDIPILDPEDDHPGFYAAGYSIDEDWPGGAVYAPSPSGGWADVGVILTQATIGISQNKLANHTHWWNLDEANTVDVQIATPGGSLASTTHDGIIAGNNYAMLGREVFQYRTATLMSGNTYRLSGLLRGRAGTEWAIPRHEAGEYFVALDTVSNITDVPQNVSSMNQEFEFRLATFGANVLDAEGVDFRNTQMRMKPYSPAQLVAFRQPSGEWQATWNRRTRYNGQWNNNADVPLNEETEEYRTLWFAGAEYSIASISLANDGVITFTERHGLAIGDFVFLHSVGGTIELNEVVLEVADRPTDYSIQANIDSSGFSTYTSGGKMLKVQRDGRTTSETDTWTAGSPTVSSVGLAVCQRSALVGDGVYASRYFTQA